MSRNTTMLSLLIAASVMIATDLCGQMVVDNFNGMPTQNEINSFKSYILTVSPGTGGNINPMNDWAQHRSGQRTRAMGLIYEITGDLDILDRMIHYCDVLLSTRNDLAPSPVGQHVVWTGRIDPVWPNSTTQPIGTGGEQGDPVGHLAYCARLILQTPSIWNNNVRIGDPKGYGTTYIARARRFVKEADYSIDRHILLSLLDLTNQNRMYWKSGNPYQTGTVPWNQQVMFTYAFQNLAAAHIILNDDATRVSRYDGIVRSCMDWFFSGEPGTAQPYTNSKGTTAYLWAYKPPSGREDWSHSNLDIQGIYRAYVAGKYGISDAEMLPLANTFMDVIRRGANDYAGRVDGTDGSGNSSPTTYVRPGWYVAALFRPGDYTTIVSEDLTVGGSTSDITRFSYFLWIKQRLHAPTTLYSGCNYGGSSVSLNTGSYSMDELQAMGVKNDDISSIKVKSGYTVTLYSDGNFGGSSINLSGNDACLTDNNFNDMVSSIRISANGVTLYQNCSYGGYSGSFGAGNYTMSNLISRGVSNDDVSSIKVLSGFTVTLYENDNFSGASVTLTSDNSCLSGLGWNDRVSSMRVTYAGSTLLAAEDAQTRGTEPAALSGYPNPSAREKVAIRYTTQQTGRVKIIVRALNGQEATILVDENKPAGSFQTIWDASRKPEGIYVVQMLSSQDAKTIKLILKE